MPVKTFAFIMTTAILIAVLDLIRRQKMTFKYAITWLAMSVMTMFFVVKFDWLERLAKWAGFTLPSNFIFFLLLIFVIFLGLLLTLYINEQNSRTEALAQAIAKLDLRLKKQETEKTEKRS